MKDSEPVRPTNGMEVCAIAVTYHPDSEFPARVSRVLRQVGALVIVDNGSGEAAIKMLREFAANPMITLVSNLDNLGIARALNIGIERAVTLGFKWTLLLDQDSLADEDMVQSLFAVHAAFPDRDRLAVVGSGFRDVNVDGTSQQPNDAIRGNGLEEVES